MPYFQNQPPPSINHNKHWLRAWNRTFHNNWSPVIIDNYPHNGFFFIKIHIEEIDEAWEEVKLATNNGHLGYLSAARTVKYKYDEPPYEHKVICVFTYDCEDEVDKERIFNVLQERFDPDQIGYKCQEIDVFY